MISGIFNIKGVGALNARGGNYTVLYTSRIFDMVPNTYCRQFMEQLHGSARLALLAIPDPEA